MHQQAMDFSMKTTAAMFTLAAIQWVNQDMSCDVHMGWGINPSRNNLVDTLLIKRLGLLCVLFNL